MRTVSFRLAVAGELFLGGLSLTLGFAPSPVHAAEPDAAASAWQLENTQHVEVERREGELHVRTTGADPWLRFAAPAKGVPEDATVLAFEYFCPDGISGLEAFFAYDDRPITAESRVALGGLAVAETWRPFSVELTVASSGQWRPGPSSVRLDLGERPGVRVRIRGLKLRGQTDQERRRAVTAEERREEKRQNARAVDRYLRAEWPYRIERVAASADRIEITASGRGAARVELVQLWPETPSHDAGGGQRIAVERKEGERLVFRVPRFEGPRDRIVCRWRLDEIDADGSAAPVSACHYADAFQDVEAELAKIQPASKKGLGGADAAYPLADLLELGVSHVTINVGLPGLIDDRPRRGWRKWEYAGQSWWVNEPGLRRHDSVVRFCTEHDIAVSAILLVTLRERGEERHPMVHPEADAAGVYAMPNFSDAEGALWYEAVLELLSSRYAQPGDPHGRISNWIVHNEVDFGWTWTNMGEQPMHVYLDTYTRSMRLAALVARRHNPHARVFISLTHHWDLPEDPRWRTYGSRRLLESLARWTAVEGDFAWGVAHHPYPQSLWDADVWNDDQPHDGFDTPKITFKNLDVLDRFLRQTEFLTADRRVRPVMLSEQGFHTPDYSDASQQMQAAAIVYAWRKVQRIDSIEAFHYHRWVDHPDEGGLLLGLRTLPTPERPIGERKLAWDVLAALGTEGEAEPTAPLEPLISPDDRSSDADSAPE